MKKSSQAGLFSIEDAVNTYSNSYPEDLEKLLNLVNYEKAKWKILKHESTFVFNGDVLQFSITITNDGMVWLEKISDGHEKIKHVQSTSGNLNSDFKLVSSNNVSVNISEDDITATGGLIVENAVDPGQNFLQSRFARQRNCLVDTPLSENKIDNNYNKSVRILKTSPMRINAVKKVRVSSVTGSNKNDKQEESFKSIDVFFATNRKETGSTEPQDRFGGERNNELTYGIAEVSIPVQRHKVGSLESPSIWKLEFKPNPRKHIVLQNIDILKKSEFSSLINSQMENSGSEKILLFIHGYNVTFTNAARRTAQIAYDLSFNGVPVLFSWPSAGNVHSYTVDEANVEFSFSKAKEFIHSLITETNATEIYLIAHSMGNRVLTNAVKQLFDDDEKACETVKEIILTAPDIDADTFKNDIAPKIIGHGNNVTLYVSGKDKALLASKIVHKYPRLGEAIEPIEVMHGIETIDVSVADSDFFDHSYFSDNRLVINDMFYLIQQRHRASKRAGLKEIKAQNGSYWKMNA